MIQTEYVTQHLTSIWRLVAGRDDWRDNVDVSVDGVFRSFWALALSTPIALIALIATQHMDAISIEPIGATVPLFVSAITLLISLAASWFFILATLIAVTRGLKATQEAAAVIITYNWGQLLSYLAFMVPIGIFAVTKSTELFALTALPMAIFGLVILWNVIRRILPISIGATIALIIALAIGELIVRNIIDKVVISIYSAVS